MNSQMDRFDQKKAHTKTELMLMAIQLRSSSFRVLTALNLQVKTQTSFHLINKLTQTFLPLDGETHWVNYQSDENGYRPKKGKGKVGGIKPGEDAGIDPNLLKSLIG
jgi:hypothetical protein